MILYLDMMLFYFSEYIELDFAIFIYRHDKYLLYQTMYILVSVDFSLYLHIGVIETGNI